MNELEAAKYANLFGSTKTVTTPHRHDVHDIHLHKLIFNFGQKKNCRSCNRVIAFNRNESRVLNKMNRIELNHV